MTNQNEYNSAAMIHLNWSIRSPETAKGSPGSLMTAFMIQQHESEIAKIVSMQKFQDGTHYWLKEH